MPSSLAKASIWAVAGNGAQGVVTFGLLVYLARVLSPRDFGLMSLVAVGLDLGGYVTRWGQVELLQTKAYRNEAARQTSFRLSAGISLLFSLAYLVLAEPVALAFHEPAMVWMMLMCAPVFVLTGSSIVPEALLRNELRFRLLATRNTITTIAGGIVAVALARAGFGAIALAAQRAVQAGLLSIWNWQSVQWRPARRGAAGEASKLFHEGASVMMGTILPMLVPRSVDLLVGAFLGPAQLGFMRIAFRVYDFLAQMIIMPMVSVASAQFGSFGNDTDALSRLYRRVTQISAAMICPMLVGFGMLADLAIPILFGRQWNPTIFLVRIVSVAALFAPINYYFSTVMVAVGQSKKVMRQGMFQMVAGLLFAAIGSQISVAAVVAANIARGLVTSIYNLVDLRADLHLTVAEIMKSLVPPYLATGVMCVAIYIFRAGISGHLPAALELAASSLVGAATYAAVMLGGEQLGLWRGYGSIIAKLIPASLRFRPATKT